MEDNNKMSAAESIELITRMIHSTRHNLEQYAYRPFLVWGYTTIAVALAVWGCITITQNPAWFGLWFAIPVIGGITTYLLRGTHAPKGYVRTPIDKALSYLWIILGIAGCIASISSFVKPIDILFLIVLLMGSGTAITGLILQARLFTAAGLVGLALSVLFLIVQGISQCLIFAAVFFVMMVIPGHIIRHRLRKKNSRCLGS